jgi:cysteinyl-tRNA synthetase
MKNVFSNVLECIGNTPLIRINRLNLNHRVTIYAKLESRNPGGSIKDRAALSMIEAAERDGSLTADRIIVEATSGNTGIGLATVAAVKGYRLLLAMPETASMERQKILKALGAELLLTPGALGTDGAIEEVYRLVRENPGRYFMPDQFNNPANPAAHYVGTGPEIYEQTDGRVDTVVTTLGTTGTVMGILRAMRERNPAIRVLGVEPYPGHKIQGLKNMKESYVPGIFDRYALDGIIHVKDDEAFEMARRLAREEGLFVGMSSGAAMAAAIQIACERDHGIIVAVLPDGGDRYLSTNLFTVMLEPDFRFYDFSQRQSVPFKPIQEGKVNIFVTGPTLDSPLTLQEARRFLLADVLARFLSAKGFGVHQAVLIADMDSRAIQGSCEANQELSVFAQQQFERILQDLDRLRILRAQRYPRTSENVEAILQCCRTLLGKGVAYEKLRSVYFSVVGSKDYGALSRVNIKKIRVGTTVDLDAYEKLNPRDFTLLKRTTLQELKRGIYIKTDWGNVLPSWHIAAAAVAIQQSGNPLDIHVSSVDFLFPHLENVRAIAQAATGKPYANAWMLCEQVRWVDDEPGKQPPAETLTTSEWLDAGYTPEELRYWLLTVHYRKPFQAGRASLQTAAQGYRRIRDFIDRLQQLHPGEVEDPAVSEMVYTLEQTFFAALSDDLNMPRALAALFHFIRRMNPVLSAANLSVQQAQQVRESLHKVNGILGICALEKVGLNSAEERLIELREDARKRRDWDEADRLREELAAHGIRILDAPGGTRWERVGDRNASPPPASTPASRQPTGGSRQTG